MRTLAPPQCCLILGLMSAVLMSSPSAALAEPMKQVALIAGSPSHGYGSHEHYAGCRILADTLNKPGSGVHATAYRGWPEDAKVLDTADSIVIYCDGGKHHIALKHVEQIQKQIDRGCGFVCIHYAVEVPKGDSGKLFLNWLGGYFEPFWSVNPHWTAHFNELPEHPITRGVEPFEANDEWYYHMRFQASMKGVTPILTDLPPADTLRPADGSHSGNPDVRKAIANKEKQHVAWAYDRPDGGRSFGFTGGHFHWNWANPEFRKLVANAIVWTAKADVPDGGVGTEPLSMPALEANQDYDPPKNFDADKIKKEFDISAVGPVRKSGSDRQESETGRSLFRSDVITAANTANHRIDIDVPLGNARELLLVVEDGGDGNSCDWADWIDPQFIGDAGPQSLLEIDWIEANTGWGEVRKNRNTGGGEMSVNGKPIDRGIGTHANSVIRFAVPEGMKRFQCGAGLDTGGTSQTNGTTSVRFCVYADAMPLGAKPINEEQMRLPENALAGITIGAGLQATLTASEPNLKSLTNIDVDARGRIWACEVMNYRHNQGSRPEGDRILILEDKDHDGVAEDIKVFYQGHDVDTAMGICVLGNHVIVSATPNIWLFTDTDGDDRPDEQRALFTKTGQVQHDHSAHSFMFGPDGMLYWNFGNTGGAVHDADGQTVVDVHGRPVVDNGAPFYGGMVFRCQLDGSGFEVLAHNFRNNYETTVDSFGTIWQSDNDDDGNRAVRINYVMEQGNFGYRDQQTGGAWRDKRIGMHNEIPLQHWHLRDPGVVPNLLQTGAGSPTGICVYEGELLPARFHNQLIHCDAGPNVVRAYRTQTDGAGYTAEMDNIMLGERDKWFRPADVCVAPDGSLFVSDWYDPGVGGHRQGDLQRGRLFRIAPEGSQYSVPEFDLSTADGAASALKNPAQSVRYLAYQALSSMGKQAEPALLKLWHDSNPRVGARALWLLGNIEGRGQHYVDLALAHSDPNLRITALRLARHLGRDIADVAGKVASDTSPAVRRDAAIGLRFSKSDKMPGVWAELAKQHDGKDRWYLEALGIGADLRAQECFDAWRALDNAPVKSDAARDIVWRMRCGGAAKLLVSVIEDVDKSDEPTDRYFRALEMYPPEQRESALQALLARDGLSDQTIARAAERMPDFDWKSDSKTKQAITRYIDQSRGSDLYLQLVERFRPDGATDAVIELVQKQAQTTPGVSAAAMLLRTSDGRRALRRHISLASSDDAGAILQTIGMVGNKPAVELLASLINTDEAPYDFRSNIVRGLARSNLGGEKLLSLVEAEKLPADCRLLCGALLAATNNDKLKSRVEKLLPMPKAGAGQSPLPPIDQLASRRGDVARGAEIFANKGTCANCHKVAGKGKEVGPDLSEIGKKLSREAMYVALLDPSAGISHNYEQYTALLISGQVISGLKMSETDDAITLRTADAIDHKIPKDDLEQLTKNEKSLMPENLHHSFGEQSLVDLVEYLTTLKP